jgi:hypothetical protein
MPKPELDRIRSEYYEFTDDITRSGHYLGGNPLQPTTAATTIRVRNGKVSTTDGPFAETKEHLGGFYLVETDSIEDALAIAETIPSVKMGGSIEVRELVGM